MPTPRNTNLTSFFNEITLSLSKASLKYGNVIVMGDVNIVTKTKGIDQDFLEEFCDLFSLANLDKLEICHTKTHKSLIDLILTNQTSSFQEFVITISSLQHFLNLAHSFKN